MKERKKSRKKTVLIVLGILVLLLVLIASAGYFAVDKAFSVLTGSLYQSSSVQEETSLEENKSTEELPQTEDEEMSGQAATENGTTASETDKENDVLSAAQKKHGIQGSLKFSAEQVKKLEKSVSLGDKLAVMAIISRSLSASDYQTLLAMTSGGITRDEVGAAYSILSRSLSSEDKNKIYGYYSKYAYLLEN